MKILVMTPLRGQFGGQEQYLVGCIEEFTRMGHECSLAYSRMSARPGQTRLPTIHQYEISTYSDITSIYDELGGGQLREALRLEEPDVIFMSDVRNLHLLTLLKNYGGLVPMSHCNWLTCVRKTTTTFLTRTICAKTCGYRCLLHGCLVRRKPDRKGLQYHSLFQQHALLESYKDITIHLVASNYMKNRLVQHGFRPDHVKVVGYFPEIEAQRGPVVSEDVPNITFVGRIDRYKGVDYLMRALAQLSIPFRCTVIGDGDYLPYCRELSRKLRISNSVDFTGWLSRDKLTERLNSAFVLVVPSIWPEPFGIVGLEAMTCSKPVVAFDTGGISDWLKDDSNGYLVPVKRADLLAQRIDLLLHDRQRAAEMGAEGYRMVRACFSKQQHLDCLLSEFEMAALKRGAEVQPKQVSGQSK